MPKATSNAKKSEVSAYEKKESVSKIYVGSIEGRREH